MNDSFASRSDNEASASGAARILVWDSPVRVFHWLMVALFAGAWLTAEGERWRLLHATLGYTMAVPAAFKVVSARAWRALYGLRALERLSSISTTTPLGASRSARSCR